MDASLLYGLPDHEGAITQADLEADTPYNLYALGKDGKHHYFETYNEHVNFVNSAEYYGN